ncbi:transposase domain-containing protein [Rhizophagus clarus]|uniref:Transposase domain-containing protein n=1 Tax=Rhizophagus clarus TaxID=94130 RepID=A0A8H3LZL7_9GLOM|nr:transposase domain-containing protein [Rhizophagus clarus]
MSDKNMLYKCAFCLKEDANGVWLNQNTFNRHRLKMQEYLAKDENLDVTKDNVNDEYYYNESVNFNEDDNEYYSDYNDDDNKENNDGDNRENYDDINEKNDDDNNNEDDEDNDNDDDDNDDDDNDDDDDDDDDDDAMYIDDKTDISEKMIEGLKLLYLKSLYNFTESAFDDIMKVFATKNISLYKVKKYLKETTGLISVFYDMCENSCICYAGRYKSYQSCPICESTRLDARGKAKKIMPYLSIIDRLMIQYKDKTRAKELLYRHEYNINKNDDNLDDIFDGKIYKELTKKDNLFKDKRDVAFTASCDGVKKKNLLVPFLIPGPNQPKDFNTFLRPFIDEMKELEKGITCYDACTKCKFLLHAHLITWTGDIPALTKIMNITSHNSYHGCRICNIEGVYSQKHKHIYFPPKQNCMNKDHSDWIGYINEIEAATTNKEKEILIRKYGIKGKSILFELLSIKFPRSFPIDIMHLFFENIAPQMFKLWSAHFFKDDDLNATPFAISKSSWDVIGILMQNNKKGMSLVFGRPPQNIFKHNAGYKAEEWANWITLYSVPLIKTFLLAKDYAKVDNKDRSNIFLISFHYLLHVAESIEDFGPCRGYWQFLMKRMCGMLIPLVKSQLHPYANLWNNLVLYERFNLLKYNKEVCKYIFPQKEEKKWPSHIVFASPLYKEYEIYSPLKQYTLTQAELKKLKETYSAIYDINVNQIENFSPIVRKYGKLCKDGHIISSKWVTKDKIKNRNNYSVAV